MSVISYDNLVAMRSLEPMFRATLKSWITSAQDEGFVVSVQGNPVPTGALAGVTLVGREDADLNKPEALARSLGLKAEFTAQAIGAKRLIGNISAA